jgi:hypothetical protein
MAYALVPPVVVVCSLLLLRRYRSEGEPQLRPATT